MCRPFFSRRIFKKWQLYVPFLETDMAKSVDLHMANTNYEWYKDMLDTRLKFAEHITGQVPVYMVYDVHLSMMSNDHWVEIEAWYMQQAVTAVMQAISNLLHHLIHLPAMQHPLWNDLNPCLTMMLPFIMIQWALFLCQRKNDVWLHSLLSVHLLHHHQQTIQWWHHPLTQCMMVTQIGGHCRLHNIDNNNNHIPPPPHHQHFAPSMAFTVHLIWPGNQSTWPSILSATTTTTLVYHIHPPHLYTIHWIITALIVSTLHFLVVAEFPCDMLFFIMIKRIISFH